MKGDNLMNKRTNNRVSGQPLPQAQTQQQDDLDAKLDRVCEDLAELAEHPDLPVELFELIDKFRRRIEKRANEIATNACTAASLRHVASLGLKRLRRVAAKNEEDLIFAPCSGD